MRKRTEPGSIRRMWTILALTTLIAACDRASDEVGKGEVASFDSTNAGGPRQVAPAPGVTEQSDMAASEAVVGDAMATGAAAPAVANTSRRVARESERGISLGAPIVPTDPTGAMLIRQGQASVEVKRVDDAVARIRQTAAQFGGFVANTSMRTGKDEQRAATLEVRVPTAQFDALVSALSTLGKVESVAATVQDVGEEYVDLTARAVNARRVEARLVEMLSSRTGKLSEVLMVEQELRRVREEIERYDARLKWLERRTALSSLNVTLHEPPSLLDRQPGPGPLAEALALAWTRLVAVLAWSIASLGVLVPLGLMTLAIALLARRLLRPGTPPGVSGA